MTNKHLGKKVSYVEHWSQFGEYGAIRIARMLERKRIRHERACKKSRVNFKRIDDKLYQVCNYQQQLTVNIHATVTVKMRLYL